MTDVHRREHRVEYYVYDARDFGLAVVVIDDDFVERLEVADVSRGEMHEDRGLGDL